MTAVTLDGKAIAAQIRAELGNNVRPFVAEYGIKPTLAAILVGEDAASEVYVRSKRKACDQAGMESRLQRLPTSTTAAELLALIAQLNADASVHGILVQLPLPKHIDTARILDAVAPLKDVDAFHPENVGLISQGRPRYLPCTPHGIQQLLYRSGLQVSGKHAVVVGRSDIVGKPLALMLMNRDSTTGKASANATVTVCHTQTENLPAVTRQADILIAAVGKARVITAEMVKPGAVVVDVGVNRTEAGLVGDVDFDAVKEVAGYITPVPGGVGPLTVTMLLYNTFEAAKRQVALAAGTACGGV